MSDKILNGFKGALWGLFVGVMLGTGLWYWFFQVPVFFTGDVVFTSVIICGLLGYFSASDFSTG